MEEPPVIARDAVLNLRITATAKAAVQGHADGEGVTLSDMGRKLLSIGLNEYVKGKKP